jgi:YD repeat-containing protein
LTRETYNGVAVGDDYQTDYTFDLVGNRLTKQTQPESGQVELITGTFNARDWLLSEETRVNGLLTDTATYGYDDNGSLTSRTNTSGDSLTQTWSLRNRLAGATVVRSGVTTNTSYLYDDSGIRVGTTENGTTRLLLIDGMTPNGYAQVVEEYSSGGILLASFVYGMEPLSQSPGPTHYNQPRRTS